MSITLKRMLAGFIDHGVILIVISIPISIIYEANTKIPEYLFFVVGFSVYAALFFFRDLVFKNAGIGKKLLGIKIVDKINRKNPGCGKIILRNVILLPILSLELLLLIFNGERIGDILTKTIVIEKDKTAGIQGYGSPNP